MSAHLPTISRQLGRFFGVSIFLSVAILACSMVFLGTSSYWSSEAGFVLAIVHHSIALHDQRKRKQVNQLHSESAPIPASSRKPLIFLAWFTALMYTAALAIVIMMVYYISLDGWQGRFIALVLELVFLVLEIPLMVVIALWCMRERRAVLGAPEHAKWYHLPQYRTCESTWFFSCYAIIDFCC